MNSNSFADETVRKLNISVELVKSWGQSELSNGKTLSEALTINGFPLWEAIAVHLGRLDVPNTLWQKKQPSNFNQKIRPHLSWIKQSTLSRMLARKSSHACDQWTQKPTFLFLGFSDYIYRDVLQPIVKQMANHRNLQVICLNDSRRFKSKTLLGKNGEFQSIWQHWNDDVQESSHALHRSLKMVVAEIERKKDLPRIIQDQNKPLWPQLRGVFNWLFQVHLPLLIPNAAVAMHIIKKHRPALIISPDVADPRSHIYSLVGHQEGIPTLEVQMGDYNEDAVEWQFFDADRLAVWGRNSYDTLLGHGVPAERMVITGSARHDKLKPMDNIEKAKIRSQLGVPEGSVFVLFASVYGHEGTVVFENPKYPHVLAEIKKAIFQAANQMNGMVLVVKPHPLEKVAETIKLAEGNRNIKFFDQNTEISDMIRACDVFMAVVGSTTLSDALYINKLTIMPAFQGWELSRKFVNSGAVLTPRSPKEVTECLNEVIDNKSREKILTKLQPAINRYKQKTYFKVDNQATTRIVDLALEMGGVVEEKGSSVLELM
jgi:hypothetical protein